MPNRRQFVKQIAAGTTALASGIRPAARVLGANDRVRFALIGAGGRGTEDLESALRAPNTECVAVADVYSCRLDEVKRVVPNAKTYRDFRQLLDDKSIDAVIIATPQHQHALNFVPAIQVGKDVYQEKTMAFNGDHARRMRRAFEGSGRVVQVGIQSTSGRAFEQARDLATADNVGVVTAVHTHMWRNAPYGGWKRPIPPDCDAEHVDWDMFEGEAAPHAFDPNRYINWRFYWDYSGGNIFENMVHQVGFWMKALNLQVPAVVRMGGGNYLSPEMEVPDTMDVAMEHSEKILFTWNSGFGNSYYGAEDDLLLGNKGTLVRGRNGMSLVTGRAHHGPPAEASGGQGADIVGGGDDTDLHTRNFFDCVRSRQEPNCPFEIGFRSAIACRMALMSYREHRAVTWDAEREEVV